MYSAGYSLSVNKRCSSSRPKRSSCVLFPPDRRVSPSSEDPRRERNVSSAPLYHRLETVACWCNGREESPRRVEGPKPWSENKLLKKKSSFLLLQYFLLEVSRWQIWTVKIEAIKGSDWNARKLKKVEGLKKWRGNPKWSDRLSNVLLIF